jgi:hypothetical protein
MWKAIFFVAGLTISSQVLAAVGEAPALELPPEMAVLGFRDVCLNNFGDATGLKKSATEVPWLMKDTENKATTAFIKGSEIWVGPGSRLFFTFTHGLKFCNMTFKVPSELSSGVEKALNETLKRNGPDMTMPSGEKRWTNTGASTDLETTLQIRVNERGSDIVVLTVNSPVPTKN